MIIFRIILYNIFCHLKKYIQKYNEPLNQNMQMWPGRS